MPSLIARDGATISYTAEGSGPAVVMLPGLSMPGAVLPRSAAEPLLAAGHTVVTIDPRDTGGSSRYDQSVIDAGAVLGGDFATVPYTYSDMAADALDVLDALGFDSATWVGYSMGGSVLRCVQAEAPERVDATVYFASCPGFGPEPTPEDLGVVLRPTPSNRDEAIAWALDVLRWTMGRHFDPGPAAVDAAMLVDDFGWWGIPVAHLAAGIVGTPGVTTVCPDDHRMLVVFGDEDPMAEGGRAFAAAHPAAAAVELQGYGHWFPEPGPWPIITAAILDIARS